MEKKYELTDETMTLENGTVLHRIKALVDIDIPGREVKVGDLGGWIESEDNLSHKGKCWVFDEAKVYGNALVCGNAQVFDYAKVFDDAEVYDDASIYGHAWIYGDASIYDNAQVFDNARVFDTALVYDDASVYGNAWVFGQTSVHGRTRIRGDAYISDTDRYLNIALHGNITGHINFFYNEEGNIIVSWKYFVGDIDAFKEEIYKKYGESEKTKKYYAIAELALQIM